MSGRRWLVLLAGPPLIVAASIGFCRWGQSPRPPLGENSATLADLSSNSGGESLNALPDAAAAGNAFGPAWPAADGSPEPESAGQRPDLPAALGNTGRAESLAHGGARRVLPEKESTAISAELQQACERRAASWRRQLGDDCQVWIAAPYVIAGDLNQAELQSWYQGTIFPAAVALGRSFFDAQPSEEISILLFSGKESYEYYAQALFQDQGVSVYGYYRPLGRTLVMNISTGGGTLVHELTHALVDFDFSDVPDWFNEGLASLYEQCQFTPQGGITGLTNWRLPLLQQALADGQLRPLKEMIEANDFRRHTVGLNYAQARYFCMYLQERGLLAEYYERLRDSAATDQLGLQAIKDLFPGQSWMEIEADFRAFVQTLEFAPAD